MNREEIKHLTKTTIEEVKKVQYDDDLFNRDLIDLNIDSISFIKLIVNLETKFDITFGEELSLFDKNTTVNFIVDRICVLIKKGEADG